MLHFCLMKKVTVLNLLEFFLSFCPGWLTHKVISDKVHRLFVMLSCFRPDRFVQLLSLIPILFLLLVSKDLVYTGNCELEIRKDFEGEKMSSKLYLY